MRRVLKTHGRICIADLMIGKEEGAARHDDEEYIPFYELVNLFENNGYITKHLKMNELLHVVLAVPIR
jgi:hypothetical protein